jgi:hypothetical protein
MKDTGDGNTTQPICKASECPLNQNNIPHTLGLYRDPVEAPMAPSFTFGGSNPPPFICMYQSPIPFLAFYSHPRLDK